MGTYENIYINQWIQFDYINNQVISQSEKLNKLDGDNNILSRPLLGSNLQQYLQDPTKVGQLLSIDVTNLESGSTLGEVLNHIIDCMNKESDSEYTMNSDLLTQFGTTFTSIIISE